VWLVPSKAGRPLTPLEHQQLQPYFTALVLQQARIVENEVPWWLSSRMCAVVWKQTIYFRPDTYHPNTQHGLALLGHELTHVSQFTYGMTLWKYLWSCRYGYRQSCYEQQAYAQGARIGKNFMA
jgi:hypothetical protein